MPAERGPSGTGRLTFGERQAVRLWALLLVIAPNRMFDPTIDLCLNIAGRVATIQRERKENDRALAA